MSKRLFRPGIREDARPISCAASDRLKDNLGAFDFDIPEDLRARLDEVSRPVTPFPYSFFGPEIQGGLTGGQAVGGKPASYLPDLLMQRTFAGVS